MIARAEERARALYDARRFRQAIEPFTKVTPDMTVADAYRVQELLTDLLLRNNEGDRIIGYKVGLTSAAMQASLGVSEPDYGPILASTMYESGVSLERAEFLQPRVEAEVAFLLKERLCGPGVTSLDVRGAAAGVVASLEIVDSRIRDWRIQLADSIADLASNGATVTSSALMPVHEADLRNMGMMITRNGRIVSTGSGAASLGDPTHAVAWLANTLGRMGITLEAGHIVMSGALHAAFPIATGDVIRAEFDQLGAVEMRIT